MTETQSVRKRALEIIALARQEKSKTLDLSRLAVGGELDVIPDEVFDLLDLEELSLYGNNIHEVPQRIRELVNLKHLNIVRNPIVAVPDVQGLELNWDTYLRCREMVSRHNIEAISIEIDHKGALIPEQSRKSNLWRELGQLSNLIRIRVAMRGHGYETLRKPPANIYDLVDNLGVLSQLDTVSLSGIQLREFPAGIRELQQLRSLVIEGAGLRQIPEWIGELEQLELLALGSNELTTLPASLANLSNLQALEIGDNRFTEIPGVVFRLTRLELLFMGGGFDTPGHIKQVPAAILDLPRLEIIDVDRQPIEVPPPEVVAEGVDAIKNYWRQQQEAGIDYLAEAKLIIVGEAGAGKTTLGRKIRNREYELVPQEPSTEGIDVVRWSFPSAVRIRRDGQEELHSTEFKASIWDFGGQEIYHATHQFFLTRRSLYALVVDDRKEDTDFNYWLQVVELLSDGSPLLIVQNEKQDRQRDLDLGTLRAHFPSLREAFRINLATNRGLDQLTTVIRQELERLPHIGTPLPRTWSQVRTALENDPRHYISLDEYLNICQDNGFKRREDKLQLSGYLHDLGICLHFQDDPVLKNTVILKPKWGTDAVYRVLDDHAILDQRGRFGPRDLARIWCDPEYATMRDELLRLMMRFQLCYPLSGTTAYIAPQLLSPTRPAYDWESQDGLVVRYDYDFMPKGILTRFIVAVNHLIADQDLVWKSGVLLARESARAEVIEDYPRRKITVRVSGADARGLLAIVDDQLERIHTTFPRLKYEKFLPCTCDVCRAREEPFAYPLSELKDFAKEGDAIQCRVSRKLVDAAHLIRDVLPSAALSTASPLRHAGLSQEIRHTAKPPMLKEVFVSYAWTDESTALVDKLQECLAGHGIVLIRDKNEIRYKDSIREFMERIGRGKCIVTVVSRKYLESKSCMFEMTEIADRGDIRGRVFPIVLDDAGIYDAVNRLRYIRYWEQKRDELDAEMKGVGGEYLQGIREELDLFARIRYTVARITEILGDMNALTVEAHREASFGSLIQALEERLSE